VRDAVASGADALGMAGGDGSLAVVAAAALEHELPYICVPAGTRNHFALDLGIDRHDLVGALRAFTEGVERRIDVATVNGRMFLNNVSLGVYGDAVKESAYRQAKLRTLLATARAVLSSTSPAPPLRVVDDLGEAHGHPAVVLVSNNPYALEHPAVAGTRPRLDGAQLGIVVLDVPGSGRNPPATTWSAPALQVHAAAPVHAGIDGEAVNLDPLLRFAILPAALRVRISSRHPGVSPSGRLAERGRRARRTGDQVS
jgi:diacylglycerol kinase family enzyme